MSETLKRLLADKKPTSLEDEIRTRVLARYSELQGVASEKFELEATLDALHEITGLAKTEINQIASEVQAEYAQGPVPAANSVAELETAAGPGLSLASFDRKADAKKMSFVYHLVPYVLVNTVLIILNLLTTRFPWSMFPVSFWGIGLAAHYLGAVFWPKRQQEKNLILLKGQIHQVLSELSPAYRSGKRSDLFQGLTRLTLSESSKVHLEEYLANADSQLTDQGIKQISNQVIALQNRLLNTKRVR